MHSGKRTRTGANKYGPFNWRENPVEANTYINAAKRHLELFAAGEEEARDTGVNNLGAVMACCAILIDAQLHGTLIDNRRKSEAECDAMHAAEEMVKKLREAQAERDKKKKTAYKTAWVKYTGATPYLTGHRRVIVRYYPHTGDAYNGPDTFPTSEHEVDPRCPGYGIDWYGVHSWRAVSG